MKAFSGLQLLFAIIPFFWPVLWVQRVGMNSTMTLYQERISNALAVWREDLGDEVAEFEKQIAEN